jgi:DNA-3-methyladenine glycosylase II
MSVQLHEIHRFTLEIPEPFDFIRTVAKPSGWHWSTPREVYEDGILWTGMYVRGIPVGLKISAKGNKVSVIAYGKAAPGRDLLPALKKEMWSALGGDEDLPGFYRFARKDPILSEVVKHLEGMRLGMARDLFGDVILAILLQMAPMARSGQMMEAILEHYGRHLAFDGREVVLWPTAVEVAKIDPQELRRTAKLGYRAERLANAARFLKEHPITPDELSSLPDEEAERRLRAIPGVGPYSAGIILGTFPLDSWSVVIFSELFLGRTPENPRAEIDEVATLLNERFGKWRWFAFVYVVQDLSFLKDKYHLSRVT